MCGYCGRIFPTLIILVFNSLHNQVLKLYMCCWATLGMICIIYCIFKIVSFIYIYIYRNTKPTNYRIDLSNVFLYKNGLRKFLQNPYEVIQSNHIWKYINFNIAIILLWEEMN